MGSVVGALRVVWGKGGKCSGSVKGSVGKVGVSVGKGGSGRVSVSQCTAQSA